jgi:glycosyltransferase involved in cell wall biosynthesis
MDMRRDFTIGIPVCDDDPGVLLLALAAVEREPVVAPPVIVDMSLGEEIADALAPRLDRVRYVRSRESGGVSESRNRIVELAETRYLIFLDADAVPLPGWALGFARGFDRADDVALVGARIVAQWPRRPPWLFTTRIGLELLGMLDLGPEPCELPRVMGTSFALDRERLPSREPFSLRLGHRPGQWIGQEEVQLSLDVRGAGGRIVYEPGATVVHHLRPERLSWRWMLRRVYLEGRDSRLRPGRLEPFPRRLGLRDRAFQLLTTPAFLSGRLRGSRR